MREQKSRIAVTDVSGRVLLESLFATDGVYQLGRLYAAGTYVVTAYTDKGVVSKKIFLH